MNPFLLIYFNWVETSNYSRVFFHFFLKRKPPWAANIFFSLYIVASWEPGQNWKVLKLFEPRRGVPSVKLRAKAPENGWLEDKFPCGKVYFPGQTVGFRESNWLFLSFADAFFLEDFLCPNFPPPNPPEHQHRSHLWGDGQVCQRFLCSWPRPPNSTTEKRKNHTVDASEIRRKKTTQHGAETL